MELLVLVAVVAVAFYFMSALRRSVKLADSGLHISLDKAETKLSTQLCNPKEVAEARKKLELARKNWES